MTETATIRALLEAHRSTTVARIRSMTIDFDAIVSASTDSNADDEHDPEGATIAFERAQVAALLSEARASLNDLDRALARLEAGVYSTCERCGDPIGSDRLAARPAASTCIACAASPRRSGVR
ncbi:MAG TPA: TraR/DksA family transcriptional regulator [Acidimicrobiales bacterium]